VTDREMSTMKRWDQRIEEAKNRHVLGFIPYPRFTADERELASNWATCAVGEVRRRYGVRMDGTLGTLGVKFYRAVLWNMVERAGELREAIENHALDKKREEWERQRSGVPATPEDLEVSVDAPAA
jgi:hypothetical protein